VQNAPGNIPGNDLGNGGEAPGTAGVTRGPANSIGWVTTRQAARALGVQPRQVRNYIADGELEAVTEGSGVNRRYLVPIASVETLRQRRRTEGKLPGHNREVAEGAAEVGHSAADSASEIAELIRELTGKLEDAQYELGRAEARIELTTQTESTLREALERERQRADQESARADRLEAELAGAHKNPPEPQDAPETAPSTQPGMKPPADSESSQEPTQRRSWLYRFFFGP